MQSAKVTIDVAVAIWALWPLDPTFQAHKEKARLFKIVNDCAERGVALIQSYNAALTKDKAQKQYLLQLVSNHRREFPVPMKEALSVKF